MSYILKSIYMIWCRPAPWEPEAQLAVVAGPDGDTASMPPLAETPDVRWLWVKDNDYENYTSNHNNV